MESYKWTGLAGIKVAPAKNQTEDLRIERQR